MNPIKSLLRFMRRGLQFILHGVPNNIVNVNVVTLAPSELLKGRHALITGGTSGIGYEIAKAYIFAGATVCITGRAEIRAKEACDKLKKETNTEDKIFYIALDNTKVDSFEEKLTKVISQMGSVDILVNNAGVNGGHISNTTTDEYDIIMNTNLRGVFFLSKSVGAYMRDNDIKGNILNIASSSSLRPAVTAYTLTKWGVRGLTMGLAKVLAEYGITVNALAPGPTATPMLKKDKDCDNYYCEYNPLKRFALPEEIANMAVILVSDMGRTILGDVVYMTGGAGVFYNDDMVWKF